MSISQLAMDSQSLKCERFLCRDEFEIYFRVFFRKKQLEEGRNEVNEEYSFSVVNNLTLRYNCINNFFLGLKFK